jgi:PIN domain nuclease of toxin-antitoxin system
VKYLLDTHALIWYFDGSDKLSKPAADIIVDTSIKMYVSIVSLWEFSIKYSVGKLKFKGGLPRMYEQINKADFIIIPITRAHLTEMISLPFIHRDPFDRLIVSVARAEGMTILTADENIHKYDAPCVW